MGGVIRHLLFSAAIGFSQGALHAASNSICIHNHATLRVARGAANGLNQ